MFISNIQFGYPCPRGGGQAVQAGLSCPPPTPQDFYAIYAGFGSGSVISQFLLHHYLGIFRCKRYKHYFSQTEMFTSNIQFGYPWVGGKLSRLVYLAPRLGFESGIVISQFLLHHNLGIFSCKSCEHYFQSNTRFGYPCSRGGGTLSRLVY